MHVLRVNILVRVDPALACGLEIAARMVLVFLQGAFFLTA